MLLSAPQYRRTVAPRPDQPPAHNANTDRARLAVRQRDYRVRDKGRDVARSLSSGAGLRAHLSRPRTGTSGAVRGAPSRVVAGLFGFQGGVARRARTRLSAIRRCWPGPMLLGRGSDRLCRALGRFETVRWRRWVARWFWRSSVDEGGTVDRRRFLLVWREGFRGRCSM